MRKHKVFKTTLLIALAVSMVAGIGSAAALNALEGSITTDSGVWTNISNEYYAPILLANSDQILFQKTLQENDYAQILEALVDTSVPVDLAAVEKAATDPDANLPDNMLPDGRVLRGDWREIQEKLIASAQVVTALCSSTMVATASDSQISIVTDDASYKMNVVVVDGQQYIIPESGLSSCEIIPSTNESVFYDNQGIWLVNPQTLETNEILPSKYNGKTYEELLEQATQNGNTNLVWSNQVCVNDGGSKLAYISDKENLLTYSVFMYDMETEEEILVCSDPDYNYLMIGWISDDTILCYKLKGEGLTVVAIDATGNEQVISLETDDPNIIDISGDLIAYRGPGSNDVWISRYNGTSSPEVVTHVDLKDGVVCVMAGAEEFSPSGDKFAFIYSPSASSESRYLWTIDLAASRINKEMSLPTIAGDTIGVHNFAWKNSTELVVNIYAQESKGNETISTWNYTVRGGNQDATY